MTNKQLFQALVGLCILLVVGIIGSAYLGLSMLQNKSEELEEAKIQQEVVDMQELALIRAQSDIEEYSELEELSRRIIPQEKDQARTVREIIAIAQQSGVTIGSISFPSSDLGSGGSAEDAISQATPVPGLSGLFELRITVQISEQTSFNQFIAFLEGLEQNRRTSQVQSVSISPDQNNRERVSFSINLAVFLRQ